MLIHTRIQTIEVDWNYNIIIEFNPGRIMRQQTLLDIGRDATKFVGATV